jgi:phosphotriesterase-related protein
MIRTVTGDVKKEELGFTSAHEHLLIDLRSLVDIPKNNTEFFQPLSLDNRYLVSEDPYALYGNANVTEEDVAIKEMSLFKKFGGNAVVDVTLDEIARNPSALKRISQKSGVFVVMGCGHYIDGALPEKVRRMSEKELADEMINDILYGVKDTGVKAGVIGEIGTSAVPSEDEWKNIRAAGKAAVETGCGIHVHTALWERNGLAVADTLTALGVKPEKIAINHVDVDLRPDYNLQLLDKGVFIEFDNFGKEFYVPKNGCSLLNGRFAYDLERAQMIADLVKKGYAKQILISNDICLKAMLASYGGNGYMHLTRHVVPMLLDVGLTEGDIRTIFVENPANFLDRND